MPTTEAAATDRELDVGFDESEIVEMRLHVSATRKACRRRPCRNSRAG
jgi:hypothetical protein